MPIALPTMFASASGELKTRSRPYSRCSPSVALNTPPLPVTSERISGRLASATSSPKTTIRVSCAISSLSVRLMAETIVSGVPDAAGAAAASNASEAGSTVGEYTYNAAVDASGFGAATARSAASCTSRSTSAATASSSTAVACPADTRKSANRRNGSRAASASRSAALL